MTEHYVTLFDSGFLPSGLALHSSLRRHAGDFRLWVVAMDDETADLLERLGHADVSVLRLHDVETSDLARVRPTRSRGEYCWTLTPFTPGMVLDREPSAERVTYLDADMWLTQSPAPVFAELEASGASVLITEHAYAPDYEQSAEYGTYCVQFMPFVRGSGDDVARWWQDRCLEWCYAVPDAGRFGDQKYLDDWPTRFGSLVHVLQDRSLLQAPWNAVRFDAGSAAAFHFHRLRTASPDEVLVGLYRLPRTHVDHIYRPYLADLRAAYGALAAEGFVPTPQQPLLTGRAGAKEHLAFRLHNWRAPRTPYRLRF